MFFWTRHNWPCCSYVHDKAYDSEPWGLRVQALHLDPGATRALACRADAYEEMSDLQHAIQVARLCPLAMGREGGGG